MADFFVFVAIIFGVICLLLIISQVYVRVRSTNLQVGDLVRTSFTACPAVLTGALWGHGNQGEGGIPFYAYSNSYDSYSSKQYWSFDAANALHCDVYGAGFSTVSTWIMNSGQNYRTFASLSYLSVTQRYYQNIGTCTKDSDCQTNTHIQCGPGYIPPFKDQTYFSTDDFGAGQCPPVSSCSLCIGAAGVAACQNYGPQSREIGTCIMNTVSNLYSCTAVYQGSLSQGNYCSGAIYNQGPNYPHPFQAASCDPANNLSNSSRCNPANGVLPFFCNFNQTGNLDCLYGQQCITNPNSGNTYSWPYNTNSNICSGTVLPDVVINLDWIAEGVITSITTGTGTPKYNVQWTRVQNLYNGIGPSPLWCQNGKCKYSLDAVGDTSWQYNDCRFLLQDGVMDGSETTSRHYDVAQALLGNSMSDPLGWSVLSNTKYVDSKFIDYVISSVSMYISTASVGGIDGTTRRDPSNPTAASAQFFGANNDGDGAQPYAATSWNLRAQNLPSTQLQKIFFYSIMPVDFGTQTDQFFNDHVKNARDYNTLISR
jgi:hypothetical protein